MSARRHLPPLLAALVLLTVSALADAPSGQYDPFTKTAPKIRDKHTLLQWQRFGVGVVQNGSIADGEAYCESVGKGLGGGAWRLPTVKELLTLVDEDAHDEADADGGVAQRAIDRNAFPGTPVDQKFLAAGALGDKVWFVDFSDGTVHVVDPGVLPPHYIRCVLAD